MMEKISKIDEIMQLIGKTPGIRSIEIADALNIDANIVQPMIQSRIKDGRIVVGKSEMDGRQFNTYTLSAGSPVPVADAPKAHVDDDEQGGGLPVRQRTVPAASAKPLGNIAPSTLASAMHPNLASPAAVVQEKTKKAQEKKKAPVKAPAPAPVKAPAPAPVKPSAPAAVEQKFVCSVHHDGGGEIRTPTGYVSLNAEEVQIIKKHFAAFGAHVAA